MKSKFPRLALATALLVALTGLSQANAADIIPVYRDAAGFGYNENTPVAPVGGNPGTTRGEQRRIVAQYSAVLWGSVLQSNVPIYVDAGFQVLGPGVLGSAGTVTVHSGFPNAPVGDTWYHAALADSLAGYDLSLPTYDIRSNFSSTFVFYYGLDGNTPAGQVNFLDVVMHEYAHGLGFSSFASAASGAFFQNRKDTYSLFAYHNPTAKFWPQMTNAERQAAVLDYGNVVFTGARATAGAQLLLGTRRDFRVTAPGAVAGNYSFNTVPFGPAVTNTNFTGELVVGLDAAEPASAGPPALVVGTTTDGCSALTNAAAVAGKYVLLDRNRCPITEKVKNAQNAGAKGVVIANNATGNPPPSFAGVDPTLTIPTVVVTLQTGNALKAAMPGVQVTFIIDPTKRQGADDLGRPRLFAPNPVQGGSSFSHFDSIAEPNLLMEPAINGSLKGYYDLDITPALLADIGWKLNTASARLASPGGLPCDAGVPVTADSGLMAGATVQAAHELCLVTAQSRAQFLTCTIAAKDRLLAAGLITDGQAQQVQACQSRIASRTRFPIAQ